jgi:hypothetical protein
MSFKQFLQEQDLAYQTEELYIDICHAIVKSELEGHPGIKEPVYHNGIITIELGSHTTYKDITVKVIEHDNIKFILNGLSAAYTSAMVIQHAHPGYMLFVDGGVMPNGDDKTHFKTIYDAIVSTFDILSELIVELGEYKSEEDEDDN